MNRHNRLFMGAIRNFAKSANVSGKSFCLGGKAFFEKSEEPFLGRKGHRACIKTLSFEPVPVFHDVDGLLLLTFCVPVLKVRFHRLPVFTGPVRSALSWMQRCRYSPNPFFKLVSTVFRLYRFRPFRFVLNEELLPFLTRISHPKTQAFGKCSF